MRIEGFDDILNSLELTEPTHSVRYVSVRIWDGISYSPAIHFPPVDLWLPSEHLPKLDKLRKLIGRGLEEIGHLTSERLVDAFLPLICIIPGRGRKKLEWLFSGFRETAMTQTLVLPIKLEDSLEREFDLMNFVIKPFRAAPKLDFAFAASSPLIAEPSVLQSRDGNLCIERIENARPFCDVTAYEATLKDLAKMALSEGVNSSEQAVLMLGTLFQENYAWEYWWRLQDEFLADFRDAQAPHVALGGVFFPINDLRTLDGCLFLNEWHESTFNGSRGMMQAMIVEQAYTSKVAEAFSNFLSTYQDRRDLARTISLAAADPRVRDFARIVMMAQEQAQEHRIDMAFLLCCTALESLLVGGPNEPISRTLARRLGALRSLSGDYDFPNVSKQIVALYNIRSRFTHTAEQIDPEALDRLFELCRCAYVPAVLASVAHSTNPSPNWISQWHTALDYLAAALSADVQLDGRVLMKAGIQPSTTPPSTPV